MKRTALLALSSAVVVAIGAGGFVLGRKVKSPADAAAAVAPPTASRLAVPVEKRVLSATIITRGDVRFGDPKPVVLPPSALKSTGGNLVTLPATKGQEIAAGKRVFELAGRPVLALVGATPAYRDMRPGDDGDDIRQLEDGLASLGFSPGAADGRYDANTARAVENWYRSLGYEAFGPTEAQRTQLQQLRDASTRAADSVRSAKRAYDTAASPARSRALSANEQVRSAREKAATAPIDANSALAKAQSAVAARQSSLDQAIVSRDLAKATLAKAKRDQDDPASVAEASRAVDDAKAAVDDATIAIVAAQRGVEEAQRGIDDANASVIEAQRQLEQAKDKEQKTNGFNCNPVTLACEAVDLTPLKDAVKAAESRVRQANAGVETAKSAYESRVDAVVQAQRSKDRSVRAVDRAEDSRKKAENSGPDRQQAVDDAAARLSQAEAGITQAERDLQDAIDGQETAVRQSASGAKAAGAAVSAAEASRAELTNPAELRSLLSAVDSAVDSQQRANADLAELQAKVGIAVPANEVIFLPDLPRRVDEVKVGRSEPANGPVITVTNARLAVDTSVDSTDATKLRVGAKGEIEAEDLSLVLGVSITKVANRPGTDGAEPDKVRVELTIDLATIGPDGKAFDPSTLNGVNVKVTIPIQSTGTAVLAVPVAAVSLAGDGSSRIEVEDSPAKPTRFVTVNAGLSAEGFVEIIPLGGGKLQEGDLVVVGSAGSSDLTVTTDQPSPSADTGTAETEAADTGTAQSTIAADSTAADVAPST
jgi:Putative peptidoglycan binding domain